MRHGGHHEQSHQSNQDFEDIEALVWQININPPAWTYINLSNHKAIKIFSTASSQSNMRHFLFRVCCDKSVFTPWLINDLS